MSPVPGALWVVDPSLNRPEDEGVAEVVGDWPGPWRLFRPALRPGDGPRPETGHDAAAVVVMGSAASVHDDLPWLAELSAWLRPMLDGSVRRPVLGICFGHQLIGHLAGAPVAFLGEDRGKRVGVETTRLRPGRLLGNARASMPVVVSHREVVLEAPRDFRVVAERDGVPVDGLEHNRLDVHAFQFHPEARAEFAGHAGIDPAGLTRELVSANRSLLAAFRALAVER